MKKYKNMKFDIEMLKFMILFSLFLSSLICIPEMNTKITLNSHNHQLRPIVQQDDLETEHYSKNKFSFFKRLKKFLLCKNHQSIQTNNSSLNKQIDYNSYRRNAGKEILNSIDNSDTSESRTKLFNILLEYFRQYIHKLFVKKYVNGELLKKNTILTSYISYDQDSIYDEILYGTDEKFDVNNNKQVDYYNIMNDETRAESVLSDFNLSPNFNDVAVSSNMISLQTSKNSSYYKKNQFKNSKKFSISNCEKNEKIKHHLMSKFNDNINNSINQAKEKSSVHDSLSSTCFTDDNHIYEEILDTEEKNQINLEFHTMKNMIDKKENSIEKTENECSIKYDQEKDLQKSIDKKKSNEDSEEHKNDEYIGESKFHFNGFENKYKHIPSYKDIIETKKFRNQFLNRQKPLQNITEHISNNQNQTKNNKTFLLNNLHIMTKKCPQNDMQYKITNFYTKTDQMASNFYSDEPSNSIKNVKYPIYTIHEDDENNVKCDNFMPEFVKTEQPIKQLQNLDNSKKIDHNIYEIPYSSLNMSNNSNFQGILDPAEPNYIFNLRNEIEEQIKSQSKGEKTKTRNDNELMQYSAELHNIFNDEEFVNEKFAAYYKYTFHNPYPIRNDALYESFKTNASNSPPSSRSHYRTIKVDDTLFTALNVLLQSSSLSPLVLNPPESNFSYLVLEKCKSSLFDQYNHDNDIFIKFYDEINKPIKCAFESASRMLCDDIYFKLKNQNIKMNGLNTQNNEIDKIKTFKSNQNILNQQNNQTKSAEKFNQKSSPTKNTIHNQDFSDYKNSSFSNINSSFNQLNSKNGSCSYSNAQFHRQQKTFSQIRKEFKSLQEKLKAISSNNGVNTDMLN